MRLKLYRAPTMGAAMARVRTELGPDALILTTRKVDGGVELTAALEQAPDPVARLPDPGLAANLAWHGVPPALATALSAGPLAQTLGSCLAFAALDLAPGSPPLLLAGPPGAGKTLTTARIATRLVMSGRPPLVISADGKRAGAPEQLAAFTRLLGLTLIVADEPATLARALVRRDGGAPVLIDTPGLDTRDPDDRAVLAGLLSGAAATACLVVPAGLDPNEAAEIAQSFRSVGARLLIATRLDQSRRLGGILAAAGTDLALTEAGIGPGAADGLCALTPAFLAARLAAARSTSARSDAA